MKGITPVIATILLLFVTITMVGFAFVWFSRIGDIVANQTTGATEQTIKAQGTKALIDSIDKTNDKIYIRNSGTSIITVSEMSIYINGTVLTSCTDLSGTITPGATATCTVANDIGSCASVKVTTIGSGDSRSC